ncbi:MULTISPECIES: tRNA epoxyqueuosine(34) reductase QueG [unclassified Methylophaga]|jgi:epoxyqueuosine reductase|uniref:tRNA epoxyqueuosine(34) reductase QueG n=1 Tax=unclassified Methylophaga TaxID=2629249 RepID=UPI000C8B92A1|nr:MULTISPECIES: tRNA epoxyqueuosine(34) reductase QueG [unclassified Methylophaga]MAK67949.1 tRNA epoxyqueuosine(34) reductase QueG [Methylophaga sp.]MAY16724.1 tRNA epoxyqueuosine(34) reductase QueG [Methylophaga sp.]MBN46848.1 tRNA epoxyqueuosine(34) reductase QueG [Methylophaga sp.]HAO23931.1 tRNA epoxyqueuosine(34) reductase QueG [Methylophaga sp.]|tara:strand:- start:4070 stop:5143 length:1074 start_codon:yes stop_codon:yes gene_type:complete
MADPNTVQFSRALLADMQIWARSLGFQQLGVSDIDLSVAEDQLQHWLARGFHGEMDFMQRHGSLRSHPEELVPGTVRVITARMDYWPETAADAWQVMGNSELGFVSRYALGRDYHKLIRKRLLRLSQRIEEAVGEMGYRVFTDSAPVMEKALAQKSGLGWIGKHTNVLNRQNGSYFFLGEIYTDLPLPLTEPVSEHCGSCTACIDICPTQAIVAPYELDARRCISYLTIELRGSIPIEFRSMMGNRIYGCDDCQLVCPWNKFAQMTTESAYLPRQGLDAPQLVDLFGWTEQEFLQRLEGSPIRRIGYECWLRNIAVALGNAQTSDSVLAALNNRAGHPSELVREHVLWALAQHQRLS